MGWVLNISTKDRVKHSRKIIDTHTHVHTHIHTHTYIYI